MANIGTLMGFIKLDSSGVRQGVSQSLENLQRLEVSFKNLAKVSSLASEFQFDPSKIKSGVTEISSYLDDLQRRIETSSKRITSFFEKVGADPTDLKKNVEGVTVIIDEMKQSLNELSQLKIATSTEELNSSIQSVKDSFKDVDKASGQTANALDTFARKKIDTTSMKRGIDEAISSFNNLEKKMSDLSSMQVKINISTERGQIQKQIEESTANINLLKQKFEELSKVRVSRILNVEEQIKRGIDAVNVLKQKLTDLQTTRTRSPEITELKNDIDVASLKVAALKDDLQRLSETKPRGSIGVEKEIQTEIENIDVLQKRLETLPVVDILSPQQIKKQIDETVKNIDVFQQRINKMKGEMKTFEKFGIDTTEAMTEIKLLGENVSNLDKKIGELKKINVETNFSGFNEKVVEIQKSFENLQGTVQDTERELNFLSKSAIGSGTIGEIDKEYLKVLDTVSNLKFELKEVSKAGGQEFIDNTEKMIGKFEKLGETISGIQNEIAQVGKKDKGLDTSAVQAKFQNLLNHVETLKTKLETVSHMSLKTDTEGVQSKVSEINSSLSGMQQRLNSVGQITKDVIATKTNFNSWAVGWHHLTETLAVVSAKFLLIEFALKRMLGLFTSLFRPAYKAVDDFRTSIVQLSSMIVSMQMPDAEELAGAYNKAKGYSEGLLYTLQDIDQQSIATMNDLRNMTEEFIKQGVLLNYLDDTAVKAYKNIANAVAVVAAAYPARETQIRQEIRALLHGQADVRGQLASQLNRSMGGKLKENLKLWKETDTIIIELGKYFEGFAAASDDINGLWASISATMTNIRDRILRGGFADIYVIINDLLKKMNQYLADNSIIISQAIYGSWLGLKGTVISLWTAMQPFIPLLKDFGSSTAYILKGFSILAYAVLPILADRFINVIKLAKGTLSTIAGTFNALGSAIVDIAILDYTFQGARDSLKEVQKAGDDVITSLNALDKPISIEIDSRIDDFNRQISMIGVHFDSVKGSLKSIIIETGKFADELKEAGRYTAPIKKTFEEYIQLLNDIKDKKITFDTMKGLLDAVKKAGEELEGNINLNLIPSIKVDTRASLDTLKFAFDKMQEELVPIKIPLSIEDSEKTMKEFYGGMQLKSAEWFAFEQNELRKNKIEWDKVAEARKKTGEKEYLISQAESDRRYTEQTITNAHLVLDSIMEFSKKRKDIEREITHETKSELDQRLEDVKMWSEKTEKELKEAYRFKLDPDSLQNFERLMDMLDKETKRRQTQIAGTYFSELTESVAKYNAELAKAQGATGDLGHDEAIQKQIEAFSTLIDNLENYVKTLDVTTAKGKKDWNDIRLKIEETRKTVGDLNADIGQFAIRNAEIELDVKIKNIEHLQKTFQISEKNAINQTVEAYERLLVIHEKTLEERAKFGSDEEWIQYREQVQKTREKLLELQATQLQVSNDISGGMRAGFLSYINDNQSLFKFGMESTKAIAESAASTLTTIFDDFRHGEMKSWGKYLTDFAEMVLQTMERLLAQMLVARMLMWAGFGMAAAGAGGGGGGNWGTNVHTGGRVVEGGIAERFHFGGITNLKSDEIPAILQTGEGILSRKDMFNIGGKAGFQEIRSLGRAKKEGSSFNISVPVNIEGDNKKLASRLKNEIEITVKRVIKDMM